MRSALEYFEQGRVAQVAQAQSGLTPAEEDDADLQSKWGVPVAARSQLYIPHHPLTHFTFLSPTHK